MVATARTPPAPRVHLACGDRRSQDIAECVDGVPGDARAETMQQVLQVVLDDLGVEVVQVQTHAGYAYHLDMSAPLDTPLVATAADDGGDVRLMPRVSLLATTGGPHLDAVPAHERVGRRRPHRGLPARAARTSTARRRTRGS